MGRSSHRLAAPREDRPPARGLHFPYAGLTPNPRAVPILRARMRLALLTAVVLVLAVPAGWAASAPAGSLSVEDARGTVVLKGKGIVIGRLDRGEVEIVDLSPLDQWSPRVNGVTARPHGLDTREEHQLLRPRRPLPGHDARRGILGLRARSGSATLTGRPTQRARPARTRVGDDTPVPLPVDPGHVDFGLSAVVGPAAGAKAATP